MGRGRGQAVTDTQLGLGQPSGELWSKSELSHDVHK